MLLLAAIWHFNCWCWTCNLPKCMCAVKVSVTGVAESSSEVCVGPWRWKHSHWVSTGNWVGRGQGGWKWQVVPCRRWEVSALLLLKWFRILKLLC